MPKTREMRHVSVSIERTPENVYHFLAKVENMACWAAGLGKLTHVRADEWRSQGPIGDAAVRFVAANAFGVVDHDVTLPSGITVHNALRVIQNAAGSEVLFSVIRQDGMSDDEYARDIAAVSKDLSTLKELLESGAP